MSYSSEVLADSPVVWHRLDAVTAVTVAAATASSNFAGELPSNAFDGSGLTEWTTASGSTGWLRAELSSATILTGYAITSRPSFATRAPNTWTFEGSNDGSSWTTLDTRSSVTWTSGATKSYTFSNSTAYLYYRLNVSANNGDSLLDVAELAFPFSADSSGNARGLISPNGTYPTVAADGPKLNLSTEWGASSGHVRTAYEQSSPTVGTFEFWLKFASNPAADLTLASWSANGGGNGSTFMVQLLTTGKIRLRIFDGGSFINLDSTSAVSTGSWHHIIASEGAAGNKLRIDKVNAVTPGATTAASSPGTTSFRLHGHYTGAANSNQTGAVKIADAAFYATQLSDARTDAHYDAAETSGSTGTGSLSLSGSGAAAAPASGSGSLSLSGSGAAAAPVVGSGSLTLSGTGVIDFQPASGSGSLTLTGSGAASAVAVGSGSLTLSGAGSATLGATGTGFLSLSATGAAEALYVTDTSNFLFGRNRRARASVSLSTPVADPPDTQSVKYDKSVAYPTPTLVNGRPT